MRPSHSTLSLTPAHLFSSEEIDAALQRVISAILELSAEAWAAICKAGELKDEHRKCEVRTTGLLRNRMLQIKHLQGSWSAVKFKIKIEVGSQSQPDLQVPDGSIDIEVIYSLEDDPDFRIECKRVSNSTQHRRDHLAREYIKEGVLRFVEDKYGRGHRWAAMFAYAVDGDAEGSSARIGQYVARYKVKETRTYEPWCRETRFGNHDFLYRTGHLQGNNRSRICLLHFFLPFPKCNHCGEG